MKTKQVTWPWWGIEKRHFEGHPKWGASQGRRKASQKNKPGQIPCVAGENREARPLGGGEPSTWVGRNVDRPGRKRS